MTLTNVCVEFLTTPTTVKRLPHTQSFLSQRILPWPVAPHRGLIHDEYPRGLFIVIRCKLASFQVCSTTSPLDLLPRPVPIEPTRTTAAHPYFRNGARAGNSLERRSRSPDDGLDPENKASLYINTAQRFSPKDVIIHSPWKNGHSRILPFCLG